MSEPAINKLSSPSPLKVARRALVLATISCRATLDGKPDSEDAIDLAAKARTWLSQLSLDQELTDWERKILSTGLGKLPAPDRIEASWLAEGLVVLAWALGRVDMPPFDAQCNPAAAASALGFLHWENILSKPSLRFSKDLREYNEFVHHLHWRLRDFSANQRPYDFESLARKTWGQPVLRFGLKLSDRDIQVDGQPLSRISEDRQNELSNITRERHRASNWLFGSSENYYEVLTDT